MCAQAASSSEAILSVVPQLDRCWDVRCEMLVFSPYIDNLSYIAASIFNFLDVLLSLTGKKGLLITLM